MPGIQTILIDVWTMYTNIDLNQYWITIRPPLLCMWPHHCVTRHEDLDNEDLNVYGISNNISDCVCFPLNNESCLWSSIAPLYFKYCLRYNCNHSITTTTAAAGAKLVWRKSVSCVQAATAACLIIPGAFSRLCSEINVILVISTMKIKSSKMMMMMMKEVQRGGVCVGCCLLEAGSPKCVLFWFVNSQLYL